MPTSPGDLLTPTEHEAAQLLVTLAWRLDGGTARQRRSAAGQALQHPDQRRGHGKHRAAPRSRTQCRTRAPETTDRGPRPPPRLARCPSRGLELARLDPDPDC
jgi:hypothetical protein